MSPSVHANIGNMGYIIVPLGECLFSFFLFFFFSLRGDQLTHISSTFFGRDQSTVAQCGRVFPDELRVSSFSLTGSDTMPVQHRQPILTSLGHDLCVLRCNLPPAVFPKVTSSERDAPWRHNYIPYGSMHIRRHRHVTIRKKSLQKRMLPGDIHTLHFCAHVATQICNHHHHHHQSL